MTNESVNTETIEELKISTIDPNAPAKERKEFPGWLYGILFVVFDAIGVAALQIGVSQSATRVKLSNNMWLTGWGFVTKMFTNLNFVAVLNLIFVGRAVCDTAHAHQPLLDRHANISGGDIHYRGDRTFQSIHPI